jgi:hypothetical protein
MLFSDRKAMERGLASTHRLGAPRARLSKFAILECGICPRRQQNHQRFRRGACTPASAVFNAFTLFLTLPVRARLMRAQGLAGGR